MIVLFTSNTKGGIIQYTLQVYKTLVNMGITTKVFLPSETIGTDLSDIKVEDLFKYVKIKAVLNRTPYNIIADQINKLHPQILWFMDDTIVGDSVGLKLKKDIKILQTMHDAGTTHESNNNSIRNLLARRYLLILHNRFFKRVQSFVLLSDESIKTFSRLYPKMKNKIVSLPLGAHMPDVSASKPNELERMEGKFFLFFGRIDKYKGISTILKAMKQTVTDIPLIIAGNGTFTDEEKELLNNSSNVHLLHRYIDDSEMRWLIENAEVVLLPYISATQSGVIPIAYHCGKPVFVSNVPGLKQVVVDDVTGYICKTDQDWIDRIDSYTEGMFDKKNILDYYRKNFDWNNNIKKMLGDI